VDRKAWDQLISTSGAVLAVVLLLAGAAAIYGGNFGRDNVTDRLEPQRISFPPAEAMTPEETEEVGDFAGETVLDGNQAEAFSRYIGIHLADVNEGATYAETSAAAMEEGLDPDVAADLQGKADTLFKGESLRAILLNAYGWWVVSTLALWVGYGLVLAGIVLAVLAILGFRHAKRAAAAPGTT
jgi:hypothetical protein